MLDPPTGSFKCATCLISIACLGTQRCPVSHSMVPGAGEFQVPVEKPMASLKQSRASALKTTKSENRQSVQGRSKDQCVTHSVQQAVAKPTTGEGQVAAHCTVHSAQVAAHSTNTSCCTLYSDNTLVAAQCKIQNTLVAAHCALYNAHCAAHSTTYQFCKLKLVLA